MEKPSRTTNMPKQPCIVSIYCFPFWHPSKTLLVIHLSPNMVRLIFPEKIRKLIIFGRYKPAPEHKPKKTHKCCPVLEGNFLQKIAIDDASPIFLLAHSLFIGHLRYLNREIALLHAICKALEKNHGKWRNRKIKFTRCSKNSIESFLISQTN